METRHGTKENVLYKKGRTKTVLQIFNKSLQPKTSTKHFSFSKYKCKKKKKKISYRFFATRQRNIEKSGCEEKEQNQSGTYGYALLPSRNTSIAPRYILPNARTNIHPALLITARSSMPLTPRR